MSKRDYYEVLGVPRDASVDVIKKSFRKIALESHPDRNPGDDTASERFKEANEAFNVLSDPQKRETYDRYGHEQPNAGMSDINMSYDISSFFNDFGFESFEDMFGVGPKKRARKQRRNSDLNVKCSISLAEAMLGCKKEIEYIVEQAACTLCDGSGTKPEHRNKCSHCNGSGKITARQGFMVMTAPCGACGGKGFTSTQRCDGCNGCGVVRKLTKLNIVIPRGISSGQTLKVPCKGETSVKDAPPGDLYVHVVVNDSAVVGKHAFNRSGTTLHTNVDVSVFDVLLGTSFDVSLPTGEVVHVELPRGHQPKDDIVVKEHGVHELGSNSRGNLTIGLNVAFPSKVDDELAEALKSVKERCGC